MARRATPPATAAGGPSPRAGPATTRATACMTARSRSRPPIRASSMATSWTVRCFRASGRVSPDFARGWGLASDRGQALQHERAGLREHGLRLPHGFAGGPPIAAATIALQTRHQYLQPSPSEIAGHSLERVPLAGERRQIAGVDLRVDLAEAGDGAVDIDPG